MEKITETPLMKQYVEMKKKHPDAILLFRVGDFYETFSDDAIAASEILGITLTRRANGKAKSIELAGFPHHALDTYLPRLVRAGKRVAICEQLEDPKLTQKSTKRSETELITPFTTKLSNGLTIGPKIELKSKEINDSNGRFMIHNDRVGIFMSEPNNRWYFAPLALSPDDEARYKLYTELSWKYSEWIWVDEYEEEKLPEYYEELKTLYNQFVSKYGYLNAPINAEFIKFDAYGKGNLEILETKVVDKEGKVSYIPGKGFSEIEKNLAEERDWSDITLIISILATFSEIFNKLYIFDRICEKTKELRQLAASINLSPKKAFEECSIIINQTPLLFD